MIRTGLYIIKMKQYLKKLFKDFDQQIYLEVLYFSFCKNN